ncbi:Cation/calcium exchanger 1 [Vitis vinifera]|uniref:Cation/calcium exchanger 1 n=1 Tax=Vitis vinifera TaxID=29760 RepID=A0A438GW13_VITVI|nr:Cation/calcium exchanger 1 [Vitis vinifera]
MTAPYHDSDTGCRQLHEYSDREAKCSYVKSHTGCQNGGYISYLRLFYCNFDPVLGYSALILWLVVLFYLLGNTAANYFCCSLEGLSRVLKLSPNIAGVTLLSLGNEGVGDDSAASGSPILPVTKNFLEYQTEGLCEVEEPLLGFVGDDKPILMEKAGLVQVGDDRKRRRRCLDLQPSTSSHLFVCRLLFFLELPLYLPRRLTIPVITAERWSKPFAVVSVTIAPVLVAVVWNSHGSKPSWLVYLIGASVGTISGVVAFFTTERSNPPTKMVVPMACWRVFDEHHMDIYCSRRAYFPVGLTGIDIRYKPFNPRADCPCMG